MKCNMHKSNSSNHIKLTWLWVMMMMKVMKMIMSQSLLNPIEIFNILNSNWQPQLTLGRVLELLNCRKKKPQTIIRIVKMVSKMMINTSKVYKTSGWVNLMMMMMKVTRMIMSQSLLSQIEIFNIPNNN